MALTLEVGTNTYILLADATTYFEGALHSTAWDAAIDSTKNKALVTATRMIDRQKWQGTKTVSTQDLAFPRTGLTDKEGNALDEDEVPQAVIDATCELALALIEDSEVQSNKNSGSNVKKVQAGSASVEYFRPSFGGRFPVIPQELLSSFLSSSASGLLEPFVSGTDIESHFVDNTFDTNGSIR